jgi:hypothetical protein
MGSKFFGNRMDKQAPNKKGVKILKTNLTMLNLVVLEKLEEEINLLPYFIYN